MKSTPTEKNQTSNSYLVLDNEKPNIKIPHYEVQYIQVFKLFTVNNVSTVQKTNNHIDNKLFNWQYILT